uniref:ZF(CCHC)-19 zinc finger protein n=1 Tax=Phallusia mammillata TaxID=59560 RepID=A0A6F9DXX1_9ASCI|nr:ZF(CCHC)-19 zinc finger protein [Phallusia mammillata]
MTSAPQTSTPWNKVVNRGLPRRAMPAFNRETEVLAKLPEKKSRLYIYKMLEKIQFPVRDLEGIVERRGGLTDFTCRTREGANKLVEKMKRLSAVEFVRLYDQEWTKVIIREIPPRHPVEEIRQYLASRHGTVRKAEKLKDRWGLQDGQRSFDIKTTELKQRPIGPKIRIGGLAFQVEYDNQPPQCFVCREFGHMRDTCELFRSREENFPTLKKVPGKEAQVTNETEGGTLQAPTSPILVSGGVALGEPASQHRELEGGTSGALASDSPVPEKSAPVELDSSPREMQIDTSSAPTSIRGDPNSGTSGEPDAPLRQAESGASGPLDQPSRDMESGPSGIGTKDLQYPEGGTSGAPDNGSLQYPEGGTSGAPAFPGPRLQRNQPRKPKKKAGGTSGAAAKKPGATKKQSPRKSGPTPDPAGGTSGAPDPIGGKTGPRSWPTHDPDLDLLDKDLDLLAHPAEDKEVDLLADPAEEKEIQLKEGILEDLLEAARDLSDSSGEDKVPVLNKRDRSSSNSGDDRKRACFENFHNIVSCECGQDTLLSKEGEAITCPGCKKCYIKCSCGHAHPLGDGQGSQCSECKTFFPMHALNYTV